MKPEDGNPKKLNNHYDYDYDYEIVSISNLWEPIPVDFGIDLVPQSARLFRDRTAAAARPPPGARAGTLTLMLWPVPIWSQCVAGSTHIVEDVECSLFFVT